MARGVLSGIIWGGVVSALGAGVVSVVSDPPPRPEVAATAPAVGVAPDADQTGATTPVQDGDIVRDGDAARVTVPEADDATAATAAGADTPRTPQTVTVAELDAPEPAPDDGAPDVAVDPVAPPVQGAPPDAPEGEAALPAPTGPARPDVAEVPGTDAATAPDTGSAPDTPTAESPGPDTPAPGAAPDEPAVAEAPSPDGTQPPVPQDTQVAALPPDADTTGRPSIGTPAGSLVDRTPDVPTGAAPSQDAAADPGTTTADPVAAIPIVAHAMPFENPEDKPLMSIVLIDTGVDLTGGPVGLAALRSFPYPLTFAVAATLPDAGRRMADYRAEGFEVMALVDLPDGATAGDVEVALSAAIDAVPESVAIMEGAGTGVQGTREASDQVTEAVLATGHGLVLQSKGLNTAQKLATRAGVPAGLVFRDFDSADQTPSVIRRFLDQAAFRAGQEGGVIMVGRVRPDTISALLLWGLQDRAERVALAPVSAVLTALREDPAQ